MFRPLSAVLLCAGLFLSACTSHQTPSGGVFNVGGTVTGLAGTGLVLQDNQGDNLPVSTNGAFHFATPLATGTAYAVTISSQPSAPRQRCSISQSAGTVGPQAVTTIAIQCVTSSYAVGGTVSGLSGQGLVLQDNAGSDLTVTTSGGFTFAQQVPSGGTYAVSVKVQPSTPTQLCTVASGTGPITNANIASVVVTCSAQAFTVGGNVVGLLGSGLTLQDNGGASLGITGNGAFSFPTPVVSGQNYSVTLKTQPISPTQSCTVSGGSGIVGGGNVSAITINCSSNKYTIGGTVTGLVGSGATLQSNGTDDLSLTSNGTFAFATPLASGAAFQVTVETQPSQPSQTCVISGGSGNVGGSNVSSVVVNCTTNAYQVGGTISGLSGAGLVLQDNLGDTLAVAPSGTAFVFPTAIASGATYSVTVLTQPTALAQTCTVTLGTGTGTVTNANVVAVALTCATNSYAVAVTVTGLSGNGLVLQDNGGDNLSIPMNGVFNFPTPVLSGAAFNVTVGAQPSAPSQTCTVAGASGTVVGSPISSVTVNCSPNQYTVSGNVTGLSGSGLTLALNGGFALSVSNNGSFAFPTTLADQSAYAVTVLSQPLSPWQNCTLTGDTGTIAATNVSNVQVTCTTNTYAIGGTVTGLQGSGLVLQDNLGDDLSVLAKGSFVFATSIASGQSYTVSVSGQPSSLAQTCTVSNGTGLVGGAIIGSVTVNCVTNAYSVGGTISGLAGSVVLQNDAGDTLLLTANGAFTFAVPVASGSTYSVAVSLQPFSPSQTCTVTNDAGGTIGSAPITDVMVMCVTNAFSVGGTVVGLVGSGLVIHDNVGDTKPIASNGAFTFLTQQLSGAAYSVAITSQPGGPAQFCVVVGGTGTVGGSDVASITINCTLSFAVGGSVSGLSGSGLVLQDNASDNLGVSGNGSFAFSTPLPTGSNYSVTLIAQPTGPWQTCTVSSGAGVISNVNVSSVGVSCVTNAYTISVNVTGLSGSGFTLIDDSADELPVSANGLSTFVNPVASGGTYAIAVLTQPSSPAQVCTVASGSGPVAGANVTVNVACVAAPSTVGGTVIALTGTGLVLQDNGGDNLSVSTSGVFTFATALANGSPYSVTVLSEPSSPSQVCSVSAGVGTVGSSNITSVVVNCSPILFSSCGGSGASGPTQGQCTSAYAGTSLSGAITVTGSGIQEWMVPVTGNYLISASGAQGGTSQNTGGRGASQSGTFPLTAGTLLEVLIGQAGTGSSSADQCAGGGGASYVVANGTPLIIAGGGGGADVAGGVNEKGQASSTACTTVGAGGIVASSSWGAGGGGFSGNGANDTPEANGGASFTNGGVGGGAGTNPAGGATAGGFGGGGGAGVFGEGGAGGGGGGYMGGAGGAGGGAGSGGTSCNSGSSPVDATGGAAAGNGVVTISLQ